MTSESRNHNLVQNAANLLRGAKHGVVLTGAGISTPSGIPDFRSPQYGMWQTIDPMVVASMAGFRRDPANFFHWVRPLTRTIIEALPNPAHFAVARLEELGLVQEVITQNIDVLHSRAGSSHVHEIHGHLRTATCVECFRKYPAEDFIYRFMDSGEVPRCDHCGGILKPDVVLFGEALPFKVLQLAQKAARTCDVMLVAGTSLEVAPVSELPLIANAYGADLIIINYEETYLDQNAAVVIHDEVANVLPAIVQAIEEGEGGNNEQRRIRHAAGGE